MNVIVFIETLIASGFDWLVNNRSEMELYFYPCPVGTFSNSSSKGIYGCTPCPPGI